MIAGCVGEGSTVWRERGVLVLVSSKGPVCTVLVCARVVFVGMGGIALD